ncbi:MAG: NADH-quinone oxidoreductase subunit K [Chloracidobacterium sp. CP2_5A]|nr:MAG: NADH-quinone oxidoreductase subunit K [Chloracidobacterium sp. CP2_5A]
MVPLAWYLMLSAALFAIGAVGVFVKSNIISTLLCLELMLNAANLAFVAFSAFQGTIEGQLFVILVMAVAAAEAGVGLAIVIALFRNRETLDVDESSLLKF